MTTYQILPVNVGNNKTAQVLVLSPPRQPVKILPKQSCDSAQTPTNTSMSSGSILREHTKKRIHFSKKALTHPRPQAVTRRNTRERNRIKAVNQSFVTLANHVPETLRTKKMSKVDTLKAAIHYINELQRALDSDSPVSLAELEDDEPVSSPCSSHNDFAPSEVSFSQTHSPACHSVTSTSPSTPSAYQQSGFSYQPAASPQPTSPYKQNNSYTTNTVSSTYQLPYPQTSSTPMYRSASWPPQTQAIQYDQQQLYYQQQGMTYDTDIYNQASTGYRQESGHHSDGWSSPTTSHSSFSSETAGCYQRGVAPSPSYHSAPSQDFTQHNSYPSETSEFFEFANVWVNC